VGSVEDKVTIQAFLSDDADRADVNALQQKIRTWDYVESVYYKSKEEALEEYKSTMSNRNAEDAIAALDGENPVPASLVIKLTEPEQVRAVATRLIEDPDFQRVADDEDPAASVQYGQDTVERLFRVTRYLRYAALALVAMLTFVAFIFINNTIRLSISARRREIAIERLVGASNSFIRGPFVTEGALEALFGAVLAIIGLHFVLTRGLPIVASSLRFLTFTIPDTIVMQTYLGLLGIGLVIGLFGSAIAMGRYLRV
ncbi:MAG: ABC transporter permease, partial [Atopobiaceae bacterium]|nr:ABC transporter permease [Atopobiaceae bacterium]